MTAKGAGAELIMPCSTHRHTDTGSGGSCLKTGSVVDGCHPFGFHWCVFLPIRIAPEKLDTSNPPESPLEGHCQAFCTSSALAIIQFLGKML